jgi:3-deoxy-7-phosphoheptulonate synthase
MKYVRKLPDADEIIQQYPLDNVQKKNRKQRIDEIEKILSGRSDKKIICIGPCSADREDAVVEYVLKLAKIQEELKDKFFLVPRVYTSKPRTNGTGYKGLLHRPAVYSGHDDIFSGVIAMRKMQLHVIQQTGMFCADEMLYPEAMYYILDLLAYVAIGARSVENQQHRLTASGLEIPVGMKNPTSGDLEVLLNSIIGAQYPQSLLYRGWEVQTEGNLYAHAILRGYTDLSGKIHPNYHYEALCDFHDLYQKKNLKNMAVLIDCSHCNSRKHYDEQERIAKEITVLCKENKDLNRFVKGLLIESYLKDGAQMIGENIYGKSITDPCLGWNRTERLLKELADLC